MTDKFTHDLYSLTTGELRELILVLSMKKSIKDTAQAHINVMRYASSPTATSPNVSDQFCHPATPNQGSNFDGQACSNCGTTQTLMWKQTPQGVVVCDACGLNPARNLQRLDTPAQRLQPASPKTPSRRAPLELPDPFKPSGVTKSSARATIRKPPRIVTKRTLLYHDCQNCGSRFRQQDNHAEACQYHLGESGS
ncbi:hypothetical protein TruAng_002656 [Truncatella angustata]|nr:hypothetical protein TruAng_002656 [Truncatella angustata]